MTSFGNTPRRAVVLFDIDGTLLRRAGPHHRDALVQAVRDITGLETTLDGIPTQGMLDRDIIESMLAMAGAGPQAIASSMNAIVLRAQEIYVGICPDLTSRTCPGSLELLQAMEQEGIPAGLVTGNLTAIGWKKMEAAGLKNHFHFGAFAEMGSTRKDLVSLAIGEARQRGWIGEKTTISLVGDHPNDIEAARGNKIRSVAVCTGVVGRSELVSCQPDLIFDDLTFVRPHHFVM